MHTTSIHGLIISRPATVLLRGLPPHSIL